MKITIIGGGSIMWAFRFCRQIITSPHLNGSTISLIDIDKSLLNTVHKAAEICNKKNGNPVSIEKTMHQKNALKDADFVVVTISTGGLEAMAKDISIPEKYGIYHTVGDTVGPAGWIRAVRNIPVFYKIAADMKEVCPNAWMINCSNPLTPLTRLPEKKFGIKTIGLCGGVESYMKHLCDLAGLKDAIDKDYIATGIDHGSWLTEIYADGIDVIKKLKDTGYGCKDGKSAKDAPELDGYMTGSAAGFAIWKNIGFMPGISDRHQAENWPWFLASDSPELLYNIKRTYISDRQEARNKRSADLKTYIESDGAIAEDKIGKGNDLMIKKIHALAGFQPFMAAANYKNIGQIQELPPGAVVETRCRFDAAGVHPFCSPMPEALQMIILPIVLRQEAIIDIALSGTFDELVGIVISDPLCCRLQPGQCRQMLAEMLTATKEWIKNPALLI